ncbi:MAG: hypothetical protein V7609_502 [Verrucomicrobiota bacterium]
MIAADRISALMKTKAKFAVVTLLATWAFSALAAAKGDLPHYGSQLQDLDALIEKAPGKTLFIKVDETGRVSANINIQIQPFTGTMKEYMDASRAQFEQLFEKGWNIVSEKQDGEKEWSCELTGTAKGKDYHFYARAVRQGSKVYLITATSLQEDWGSVGEKMRRHVDAFQAK